MQTSRTCTKATEAFKKRTTTLIKINPVLCNVPYTYRYMYRLPHTYMHTPCLPQLSTSQTIKTPLEPAAKSTHKHPLCVIRTIYYNEEQTSDTGEGSSAFSLTLQAARRSLILLLTRNSAVMSRGGFTSAASLLCLCSSSTLSFSVSIWTSRQIMKLGVEQNTLVYNQLTVPQTSTMCMCNGIHLAVRNMYDMMWTLKQPYSMPGLFHCLLAEEGEEIGVPGKSPWW